MLIAVITGCSDKVELGDGVLAPEVPRQWALGTPEARTIRIGEFRLVPKAGYDITAKVLSKRHYRWDDLAAIAPWDFALGWGPLSDEALLRPMKVVQGDRFMFWHLYEARIDINLVNLSSANVHLIPENSEILRRISAIPEGAIVHLSGELVDVHFADNSVIPSSLTRRDTGPGACEILLVQEIALIEPGTSTETAKEAARS